MFSYSKQYISKEDLDYVNGALLNNYLTQGPLIEKFESSLKKKFKSKYSVAVSSGTAALHLCGIALGWKENDVVLLSSNTFVATANAVIYCNAIPDLIDIDESTHNIDINDLERKIKEYRKKNIKIHTVIATDYAGHPCDWHNLYKLKLKYNFNLINDNCHSIGAKINNDKGYAVKYADLVVHSYHPVKAITTGEGGCIFTNNSKYYENIKLLRSHGINRSKVLINKFGPWYYDIKKTGFNYRLSEISCALGISQLKKLDKFINRRRDIANQYIKLLMKWLYLKMMKKS